MRGGLRKKYDIADDEKIPSRLLIPSSIFIAVFSTAVIMPFDSMKTQKQLWETK